MGTIARCGQKPEPLKKSISETTSFEISKTLAREIAIEFGIDLAEIGWKKRIAERFGVKTGVTVSTECSSVERPIEQCHDQIIWTREHTSWYLMRFQKKEKPLFGEPKWKDAGIIDVIRYKCMIEFGYMKIYNASCEECSMRPTPDILIITQPKDMSPSLLFLKLYARWLINRNKNPSEHILAKLSDEPRESWDDFLKETFQIL